MFTIKRAILILILQFTTIQMYRHYKPLAAKIWSERCQKNSMVLNDCNWCRCNARQEYDCKARVCEEIDMFGHFKDAIQEIDVGMEGHGSWRSRPLACNPGVHYRRGAVLCVCDEDGNWPNPVCRDLFQILHSVELTGQTRLSKNDSCSPTKLYLVGCNVCFCPSSGYLDPQMCTNKECQEDDPVIEAPVTNTTANNNNDTEENMEIYAMCNPKFEYEIGCRNCVCLTNNRLLCGNCSIATDQYPVSLSERSKKITANKNEPGGSSKSGKLNEFIKPKKSGKPNKSGKPKKPNSICRGKKPFIIFKVGCNLCHCGRQLKMFCTVKKCVDKSKKLQSSFDIDNIEWSRTDYKEVAEPPDDESCLPGTIFKRDCNYCQCSKVVNGMKQFVCTLKFCRGESAIKKLEPRKVIERQKNNCVLGTFYQEFCKLCYCFIKDKIKYQICRLHVKCVRDGGDDLKRITLQGNIFEDVKALNGFCEPMRRYKNDCNVCRCLADGKTVECTSKICALRSDDLLVDIVPVVIKNGEVCPKGHSYKLDCNLCFCLSNGNAICTTADCSKQNKVIM
ncbi:uncharacterized protein LOC123865293 [Maniola jurtina]|uniref:uncharacterized protein LOC123865293 n=1 Tax=Maniola jurtina TaxID=191418 RepID=UPI001E687909|nr:uncharacterized protein LOC123865293 [Maniola jurtina]